MVIRYWIAILLVLHNGWAYVDMYGESLKRPFGHMFDLYKFQHFENIKDPRYKQFQYGFPAGIYGSSVIPTTIMFYHWDLDEDAQLRVMNFGTMIPLEINWMLIVNSCDEINFPRCSWAHFVNFLQPLQFDYYLLETSGSSPGAHDEVMIPYVRDGCWPIKSIEQICPNPCAKSPCSILPYARAGSCQILGIHKYDFKCECMEGFYWEPNTFSCVSENRCEMLCSSNNTATCVQDPKSLSLTCVCRLGYMGHNCSELLDACLIGSEKYDPADDYAAKPIVPAGKEACGPDNKCIPRLGTTSFICQCGEDYKMDRTLPYDNCAAKRDPCSNKICVEGWCRASEDGKKATCECEEGFGGERCDQQLGGWTTWTSWSSCEPFCGDQRLRRRIRVCSSEQEEDCIGPVEQVESCPGSEPCPAALSGEEVEWLDFAQWLCFLLITSVVYILALFCLLTLIVIILPSGESAEETIRKSLANRAALAAKTAPKPLPKPVCMHHCGDQ